ncbi:MAG: hypothetical protein R3Y04_02795 [Rikenellaceae bacterium]
MKSNKDFQPRTGKVLEADDLVRKSARLEPNKKSGKDKHRMFADNEDDEDDFIIPTKRESVLDYYDDIPELEDDEFEDDYDDDEFDEYDDDDDEEEVEED